MPHVLKINGLLRASLRNKSLGRKKNIIHTILRMYFTWKSDFECSSFFFLQRIRDLEFFQNENSAYQEFRTFEFFA